MTEKKKITLIGPSARFLSGISYYTTYLSNALTSHFNVNTLLFRNMLPKKLFPGAKRVGSALSEISYSDAVTVTETIDWYNPATWHRAAKSAAKTDICIFEWWTSSVAHMYFTVGLSLKRKHVPVILEFHEVVDTLEDSILPIRLYSKFMGSRIRRLASKYVVHSTTDRKLVSERYQIPENDISVIPLGLFNQYEIYNKSEARAHLGYNAQHVILFFGLLRPYKGAKYLVKAFEKLPLEIRNNTLLVIAGEPWEDKEAIECVENSPCKDSIRMYLEYISDEMIPYLFSAADTLVLPYTRASQSAVAHIGVSYAMPIVSSKVGGLAESLGSYEGTVFVPPKDEAALSKALVEVLQNRCGNTYPIPEELTWESVAQRWHDLAENIP